MFATLGFLLAWLLGLQPLTLVLTEVALASPLALMAKPALRSQLRREAAAAAGAMTVTCSVFYALLSVLLWLVFNRAMFERPDGLYTGLTNNLGDLPFHLQVINSFLHSRNFPPEDPTYAGPRFAYPFLADFLTAMFVRGGASLRGAMLVQNLTLALALAGALHRWTWELTRDRLAGMLAPLLLLLSGGLGWWLLFGDLSESEHGIFRLLQRLPHDYTILSGNQWRWGNSLTTLLVPQRSMLFGLPLAISIFTQWWLAMDSGKVRGMIAAGAVTGLLPLIHSHSFAVVIAMGGCLAILFRQWRLWSAFFAAALLIGAPEVLWLMQGAAARAQSFFGWHFGWDRGENNAIWFWFRNTGLFIPLLAYAVVWLRRGTPASRRVLLYYLPFTLCFLAPNLMKLAPWVWDNIKVHFYWYVASVPLVAWLLSHLWRRGGNWRAATGALLVALTLAGALDLWRVIARTTQYREFDRQGMAIAEQILQRTGPRSLILHAPAYNSPVFLTGRRSLLGYPGWVWSRGLDTAPREDDIQRIYSGTPESRGLLERYQVDYVLIGPLEHATLPVNEAYFARYPKAGESGEYRLYKTTARF